MKRKAFLIKVLLTVSLTVGLISKSTLIYAVDISTCGNLTQANTTYVLQNDVSSKNGCFAILANNITLDLNGHTVIYDDEPPIEIANNSFEHSDMSSWNLVDSKNTIRSEGTYVSPVTVYDGSYSLKTATPAIDQLISSSGTVTLQPNTVYSLSAMVYNLVNDSIKKTVSIPGIATVSQSGKTYRGVQWISTNFTTGSNPLSVPITLSITGASAVASGHVYFDDIRIQKWRQHGISVGPNNYSPFYFPGLTQYGTATGVIIKNGTITQGQGKGERCHAIAVGEQSSQNLTVENVTINVNGPSSRAFDSYNNNYTKILNNTINSSVSVIKSRDNYDGALIYAGAGTVGKGSEISGNVITSGIQTGILAPTKIGTLPQNKIFNNNITLQSKYTNDFAVFSEGSEIYSNNINCGSGNNSCRGIWAGGNGTIVRNNTISVQALPRNQEYNGCPLSGTYGIQTETSLNTQVFGNIVTANANTCDAIAYRANPFENSTTSANNLIHDNIFIASKNGTGRASSIKLTGVKDNVIKLYNNTFKTNSRWIYVENGAVVDLVFTGNRWETINNVDPTFYPFEVNTYSSTYFTGKFVNNTYGVDDKDRFEMEVFRTKNGTIDSNSSFAIEQSANTPSVPKSPVGAKGGWLPSK